MRIFSRAERTTDPWVQVTQRAGKYLEAVDAQADRPSWTGSIRMGLRTTKLMDAAANVMPDHPAVAAWQDPNAEVSNMQVIDLATMITAGLDRQPATYEAQVHGQYFTPQA